MTKSPLKKSLYQAFQKALGSAQGKAHAAQHVVQDILDPNMQAEVPENHIPAPKENILHKDVSLAEMHQQKQSQAEAKLGMTPKMPKATGLAPKMPKLPTPGMDKVETGTATDKGILKLKKFMMRSRTKQNL